MTMINSDEQLRSYAFEKTLREMDERVRLRTARKTGHEEGKIEGKIEGKSEGNYYRQIKTAIHMIQKDMNDELIAEMTELPLSQIIKIKNDLPTHPLMIAENAADYYSTSKNDMTAEKQ